MLPHGPGWRRNTWMSPNWWPPRRRRRRSTCASASAYWPASRPGDAICLVATGERYSGLDHAAAAELLERVHAESGKRLRTLGRLKPVSHYGDVLLSEQERTAALRAAKALVDEALPRL